MRWRFVPCQHHQRDVTDDYEEGTGRDTQLQWDGIGKNILKTLQNT